MSLFSSIANNINGLDVPLEFLHKGIFHKLLVKISFKESNSDVMQIRIYSIELSDANESGELSIFEQNAIDQDKEQIQKYIENIRKISDANAIYLGISLQHDTVHFEKLSEEQYNKLIEVLYDELHEAKQHQQPKQQSKSKPKQELTQDQITARRKELQKQLNEINTKYNKKYETEMEKIEAQHKANVRTELATYNQRRADLRKQLETAEKDETKAITDELEQLKEKVKPTTIDLSSTYEELVKNFLNILSDSL